MEKWQMAKEWALSRVGCPYLMGGTGQICTPAYRQARMAQYPDYAAKMKNNCPRLKNGKSTCVGCKWYDEEAGKGKRAYDCAQLARWCMNYVGITLVSGANSQWNQTAWVEKGELNKIPFNKLCLVYRWDESKKRMGHVGIYLGDGTVVHAKGHDYGVVHQQLSSNDFTHYGIPDGLYDEPYIPPTLQRGDNNQFVQKMQELLIKHGYTLPESKSAKNGADGIFGPITESVLIKFQKDHNLEPDGVCGLRTWEALMETKFDNQEPVVSPAPDPEDPQTVPQIIFDKAVLEEMRDKLNEYVALIDYVINTYCE